MGLEVVGAMLAIPATDRATFNPGDPWEALGHTRVSMVTIKAFALKLDDCSLKDILMAEKDEIEAEEFALKLPIFLRLLGRVE
ncbi:MAG: hypothetical protein OK436_04265 [Thaumarchaeota archaeon]|nr:hypothetical protein [Nitrososphaerota archaeon]